MDAAFAARFAAGWVAAWNKRDLAGVLEHYADDFEMSSPFIAQLAGEPSGRLRGKAAVGAYWAKALRLLPGLRFELVAALAGVDAVTILYRGHRGLTAEVLRFDPAGKVSAASAYYGAAD
jgi:ketosteroid isomerase-like protein